MSITSTVRRLPRHAIVTKLRRAGLTQYDVAEQCGCSQQMVSKAIGRRVKPSPLVERIWQELERALNGSADGDAPTDPNHASL